MHQNLQSDLDLNGFGELLPLDRDPSVTGTSLVGGLCLHVSLKAGATLHWSGNPCLPLTLSSSQCHYARFIC